MIPPSSTAGESTPTNSIQWDSSWPECVKGPERNQLLELFQDRFGILLSVFDEHHLYRRGRTVWLLSKGERVGDFATLRVESVGLPLLRWVKTHLKPTSAALQLFASHINKNIVRLTPEQLQELVESREIVGEFAGSTGYVAIESNSLIIGCALYLPGRLVSQFPRHMFTSQTWEQKGGG